VLIGLLVVSDATLFRVGMVASLPPGSDIAVVGMADCAAQGRRLVVEESPGVVAVDVRLPDEDALSFAAGLREAAPERGVVLVGPRDNGLLFRALEHGVSAYVPMSAPVEVLLSAIRHAAVAPGSFTGPDLAQALVGQRRLQQRLSPREVEVLRLLSAGSTVARAAQALLISESTVKTHLARLYEKLGVNSRAQALAAATRAGLM
jgi:DNA-binding NarL/FixJ family response regulator